MAGLYLNKTAYLQTHPGIEQSGSPFWSSSLGKSFYGVPFSGASTPPAKAAVESNDIARNEKTSFFILLI